jgi:hypothetical protein
MDSRAFLSLKDESLRLRSGPAFGAPSGPIPAPDRADCTVFLPIVLAKNSLSRGLLARIGRILSSDLAHKEDIHRV